MVLKVKVINNTDNLESEINEFIRAIPKENLIEIKTYGDKTLITYEEIEIVPVIGSQLLSTNKTFMTPPKAQTNISPEDLDRARATGNYIESGC